MNNIYRFAIHAYESKYCGLHGIENSDIVEFNADNEEEAISIATDIACDMATDVIESYSINEDYDEDACTEGLEFGTDEYEDYINECYNESRLFDIYQIDEAKVEDLSFKELQDYLCHNGFEDFVAKYCKEKPI